MEEEGDSTALTRRNGLPSKREIAAKPTTSVTSERRIPTAAVNGRHWSFSYQPPSSSFSGVDLEVESIKSPTYVSLRDLIPSSPSILSPPAAAVSLLATPSTTSSSSSGYGISIRNRLVKQAARAYLQPMTTSPSSSGWGLWRFSPGKRAER
ncbi:hypothetical protein Dimus_034784 [Dionaea muscipula]